MGFLHFGVEVGKGPAGDAMLEWTGGYFETFWSVNPHWVPQAMTLAARHPITFGVRPFSVDDEWYYHMRFRPGRKGVTPILSAVAPARTLERKDGERSGNPAVRDSVARGEPQPLMWARQRPDGGRGFGFTGGHVHWNWGHPDHRRVVLNAIAWSAGLRIPRQGVPTPPVSLEELEQNQDDPRPANFDAEKIRGMLARWNADAPPPRR